MRLKLSGLLSGPLGIGLAFTVTDRALAIENLELWYEQPATRWVEALPLGNGRLGAMVFGGVTNEHLQFNESTLWTGQPHEYQHEGAVKFLPQFFDTLLRAHLADYQRLFRRMSLDLGKTAAAKLPTDQRIKGFASGDDPALAALAFQYGRYLLIASRLGQRDRAEPDWQVWPAPGMGRRQR